MPRSSRITDLTMVSVTGFMSPVRMLWATILAESIMRPKSMEIWIDFLTSSR